MTMRQYKVTLRRTAETGEKDINFVIGCINFARAYEKTLEGQRRFKLLGKVCRIISIEEI